MDCEASLFRAATDTASPSSPSRHPARVSYRTFLRADLCKTGENVLIGGFIITGSQAKKVMVRAIGPSLPLDGALANPTLELHDSAGSLITSNDNWREAPNLQENHRQHDCADERFGVRHSSES